MKNNVSIITRSTRKRMPAQCVSSARLWFGLGALSFYCPFFYGRVIHLNVAVVLLKIEQFQVD